MSQEYIFRFVSVRPADSKKKLDRAEDKTPLDARQAEESSFQKALTRAKASNANRAEVTRIVTQFKASDRYIRNIETMRFNAKTGLEWFQRNISRHLEDIDACQELAHLYDVPLEQLVHSPEFQESWLNVADTLLAETLIRSPEAVNLDELAAIYKFMSFAQMLVSGDELPNDRTLGEIIAVRPLLLPAIAKLPYDAIDVPPPPPYVDPKAAERERLKKQLSDYEQAHRELSNLAIKPEALNKLEDDQPNIPRLNALENRLQTLEAMQTRDAATQQQLPGSPNIARGGTGGVVLAPKFAKELSAPTQRTIQELKIEQNRINPIATAVLLEREMGYINSQLESTEAYSTYLNLGGVQLEVNRLKDSLGIFPGVKFPIDLLAKPCSFQAGVGDLLLVKQTLKAYELGEFAHVENVLAGESREREHRRLNIREEMQFSEEERETDKERNLQTTDRNEMQSEAEKTVKNQFGLEAGLQVSGSYGPTVSFSANLNASFSTTTEETQRKAISYSREVTEKTSERVRERVKKELRRRTLEEIQEINRHSINNSDATNGHIRGIYRWLNKVYDAQIFNYGQRMMYEFIVPEPAAYFLYAMVENPPKDIQIIKPEPPTYAGLPLKPTHLTRTNYHDFTAKYQVRNVPAPPPEFQHVSYFDKQDKVQDGSLFGRSGKVEVPAGYEAYAASVMSDYSFTEGKLNTFHILLGNTSFDMTNLWGTTYKALDKRYRELAIAYHLFNTWSFTLGVDVYCRLTSEGFAKWQQQVYDAILEAYLNQKADYDEKMAALAIQKGIPILGRNPLENQRITREELKKLVLMMLMGSNNIALNSFYSSSEPQLRFDRACANGSKIRFFENAFEWNNLLYVLYPYFWGRKARWISALHFTDPDPDFAAFLKAGAARVQLPVRPGFERAIAHYCQFGEIWEGNDPPLRNDDLYVPIVDEIAENLGKLDDGVPYPADSKPWEVRIPTSLVLLQNLDEIPNIRDILTGNNVKLEG